MAPFSTRTTTASSASASETPFQNEFELFTPHGPFAVATDPEQMNDHAITSSSGNVGFVDSDNAFEITDESFEVVD